MKYINSICDLPEKPQPPPLAFDIPRIKKKRKRDQGINAIKLTGQPWSVLFNSLDVAAPYPLSPALPPPPLLRVPSLHFIEITTRSSSIQVNSRSLGKIKGWKFDVVRFSQLLENTYLEIEVVMVIVNNFFELFSIPKMVDMYFSTYNRDTLQAWWVVRHNRYIS